MVDHRRIQKRARSLAATAHHTTLGPGILDQFGQPARHGEACHRPQIGLPEPRVRRLQMPLRRRCHQLFHKLRCHRVMHDHRIGGHADLPLVQKRAMDRSRLRRIDIGIRQQDQRAFPRRFQQTPFQMPRRERRHQPPDPR